MVFTAPVPVPPPRDDQIRYKACMAGEPYIQPVVELLPVAIVYEYVVCERTTSNIDIAAAKTTTREKR